MAKPFNIQSPEEIAKDYGGNKQKIAEAMQMGIVDPTAGVLAGMFIDHMRSAAQMEAMPQSTVAQQVMGGAPPAPAAPPAPTSPTGGLGAMPQGVPPMAPDMSAMAPQGEAPMGMADGGMVPPYMAGGGLSDLPVPDTMFDENRNGGFGDGYAGGGIIAFAGGGMSDLYSSVEQAESGGRQSAVSPKGARGVMQLMSGTMRDPGFGVRPMQADTEEENRRVGREYLDAMYRKYGDQSTALMAYNWGPGNVDKWIAAGRPANMIPDETKKYLSNVTGAGASSAGSGNLPAPPAAEDLSALLIPKTEEGMGLFDKIMPKRNTEGLDLLAAEARKVLDPEAQKKAKKEDMWATLAQIGFNMASSNSPYFLQAVGTAASAALPGAKEDKQAREAAKEDAIRTLADVEDITYKQAAERVNFGRDYAKDVIGLKDRELARQIDIWGKQYSEQAQTGRTIIGEQGATTRAGIAAASVQPKGDAHSRVVDIQFDTLKGKAAAGQPIYTPPTAERPQGERVVVRDRQGNELPPNRISEASLRDIANKWAVYYERQARGLEDDTTSTPPPQTGKAGAPANTYEGFSAQQVGG